MVHSPNAIPPAPTPRRIVVTGATGFIGKPLTQSLLAQGYAVTALVRRPDVAREQLPAAVQLEFWDGRNPPSAQVFSGAYAVVHLAGESVAKWPWSRARRQALWHSRVEATQSLVQAIAASQHKPEAFISASGMGYHGDAGNSPVTEDALPGLDFLSTLATAWEASGQKAAGLGLRVVNLRFGMVLADYGGALQALLPPFRLGLGVVLGSGLQGNPWIHRDDAVGLILHALSQGNAQRPKLQGAVHACAPATPSQKEFAKALGQALGRPVWIRVPAWALRAALGEMADLFLHGQFGQPVKAGESGYPWRYLDLGQALRACVSRS